MNKLMLGDNIELLKKLEDNSIDSVVTDPPYGLSFMNKKWDYDVPSVEFWKEVYRVLKPGGHILSFGGTRTYHRMVMNIEDAGFEIRDQIMWLYGSGFPKSHNIGKAVDKLQGNERKIVGEKTGGAYSSGTNNLGINRASLLGNGDGRKTSPTRGNDFGIITKGQSEFEGWGSALKPAVEPICLARKPLSEKSLAENVLRWGTGGINIDGCRVGIDNMSYIRKEKDKGVIGFGMKPYNSEIAEGRFPANIILECSCDEVIKGEKGKWKKTYRSKSGEIYGDGKGTNVIETGGYTGDKGDIHTDPNCPCRMLDEQSGVSKSNCKSGVVESKDPNIFNDGEKKATGHKNKMMIGDYNDKGGASRFFYQAKVSKAERNLGLDEFEEIKSNHPTMKPVNLMTYLCRLITPPNGIVLDPFMGSGSTGIAAQLEGFNFIGMEMDEEYIKVAEARIENYEEYRKFLK